MNTGPDSDREQLHGITESLKYLLPTIQEAAADAGETVPEWVSYAVRFYLEGICAYELPASPELQDCDETKKTGS